MDNVISITQPYFNSSILKIHQSRINLFYRKKSQNEYEFLITDKIKVVSYICAIKPENIYSLLYNTVKYGVVPLI